MTWYGNRVKILKGGKSAKKSAKKANSRTYHEMISGINRQQSFEDEEDYTTFIKILEAVWQKNKFELFAYCLMGNHVNLMIKKIYEIGVSRGDKLSF